MMKLKDILDSILEYTVDFTEEMLLERISDRFRWPIKYPDGQPSIDVLDTETGFGIDYSTYFNTDGYVNSRKVINYYENGHTIILSNISNLLSSITEIHNIIEPLAVNKIFWINLYMGKGKEVVSFPEHTHDYDVIVKNVFGKSEWVCNSQPMILEAQNVLYLPRETKHYVKKIYGSKCSLTCSIKDE